ncbi:MAG: hypothetical protein Q9166_007908 [cf. Caloplaca sp. 2 TL-2023]
MAISLGDRLEAFKQLDEERHDFIKELVEANTKLANDLRTARGDHLDQLESRRMWQERAQISEAQLKETQGSAASHGFVLCLIDGDGYLFNDNLISQGATGGGEAATRLLDNIKRYIQQYEGAMNWKIIVRVYANLEGLLKKYTYIDFIEEKRALRQFVAGFTQSQPLFDFVDAGEGKERADHKIKEQLSLFINNTQCKHIMLGVAHDNGYVPALDPYKNTPIIASRISLLKPGQLGREYNDLPFEIVQLASIIFRTQELPNERPNYRNQGQPALPFKKPSQPSTLQNHKPAVAHDLTTRRPIYPGPVLLNKDDERVDEYLGTPSERGEANLEARIRNGNKLCNIYYLRGECNEPRCQYSHEPGLDEEEVVAFALKARSKACHGGSQCRSRICVLGHLCPHGANCSRKKTCYFYKLHLVDPRPDHEYIDME